MGRTRVCRRSASLRENIRWHKGRTPLQSDGANGAGRRAARLRVSVRSCGAGPKKKTFRIHKLSVRFQIVQSLCAALLSYRRHSAQAQPRCGC